MRRMHNRWRTAWWSTLVIALCAASPARAHDDDDAGFPAIDEAREPVLLPAAPALPAWSNGDWTQGPDKTTVRKPAHGARPLYLVPNVPEGRVASGLVRAIVDREPGGVADFTLLYRYRPGASIDEFDAYGASVESNRFVLYKWRKGRAFPMGPGVPVRKLDKRLNLEVVVFLAGPYCAAFLYDARTLEPLATLAHRDETLSEGHVGLRIAAPAAAKSRLRRLSILREPRGARGDASPHEPSGGPGRLVTIDPADAGLVPAALRTGVLEPLPGDPAGQLLRVERPSDVERIRRAGVRVLGETSDVAWIHVDARYRAAVARQDPSPPLDASYKDPEMVERILRRAAERHPSVTRLSPIGRTRQNRTIWGLRVTAQPDGPADKPALLLNGAHHGNELIAIELALDALETLLELPAAERDALLAEFDFWFVPLVNPDGSASFMRLSQYSGRKNGCDLDRDGRYDPESEGVDLNRNYPFQWGGMGEQGSRSWPQSHVYRGPEPASEPETQAMIALAREHHFVASISWHTSATAVLPPYTVESVRRPSPDVGWAFAEELVHEGPRQPNGQRYKVRPRLYAVDGVDQDWHAWAHGTAAVLIEGPVHNTRDWGRTRAAVASSRFLFLHFLERVRHGPRLSVHVRDASGAPAEAGIHVEELNTFAGEPWRSRAKDGRFDLIVPQPGRYHLVVEREGSPPARVAVESMTPAVVVLENRP